MSPEVGGLVLECVKGSRVLELMLGCKWERGLVWGLGGALILEAMHA